MKQWKKFTASTSIIAMAFTLLTFQSIAAKGDHGNPEAEVSKLVTIPSNIVDGTYMDFVTVESGRFAEFDAYDMQVSVKIEDGKITALDYFGVTGNNEIYVANAYEGIWNQICSAQSSEFALDAVSGATFSSDALIKAINQALTHEASEGEGFTDYSVIEVSTWSEFNTALARVQEGGTINITQDIVLSGNDYPFDAISSATIEQIGACSKTVTINGNNHSILAEADSTGFCFDLKGNITINDLIIDGGKYGFKCGGCMYITSGAVITLNHVTMKNCRAYSSSVGMGGGAIYLETGGGKMGASPSLLIANNCIFEDNYTDTDGTVGLGGAIYSWDCNIEVNNCTFRGNRAYEGGAIAAVGNCEIKITDCTFENNAAANLGNDVIIYDGISYFKHGLLGSASTSTVDLIGDNHFDESGIVLARYFNSTDQVPADCVSDSNIQDLLYGNAEHTVSVEESLKHALTIANAITEENAYTSESWGVFVEARNTAKEINQTDIEGVVAVTEDNVNLLQTASIAASNLANAQDNLVEIVDKTTLSELIDETSKVDDTWFPDRQGAEENRNAFYDAYTSAEEILSNEDATADDISNAYAILKKTYATATNPVVQK